MNEDRPRVIERVQRSETAADPRRSRSNAMVALGVVLLALTAVALAARGGAVAASQTPAGVFILGALGVGMIIGGLVIRR